VEIAVERADADSAGRADVLFPQAPAFWTEDPFDAWPRDPSDGLYAAQTVTVTLLQLAVLYGCNPIYLIGCDHSYQVPGTVRRRRRWAAGRGAVLDGGRRSEPFFAGLFGRGASGTSRIWRDGAALPGGAKRRRRNWAWRFSTRGGEQAGVFRG